MRLWSTVPDGMLYRRSSLYCMLLVELLCGSGCACEGSQYYRGSVATAERSHHTFDDGPNPHARKPIPGARVWLIEPVSGKSDQDSCRLGAPPIGPYLATTNSSGEFGYSAFITFAGEDCRALCAEAPGYELYATPCLTREEQHVSMPDRQGLPPVRRRTRYLNFGLRPLAVDPASVQSSDPMQWNPKRVTNE